MFQLVDKDKFKNVILNFVGVEFLGSAALNKLIMMDKKVQGCWRQTALVLLA